MAKKQKKQESAGAPAWMATFADMATLLMAFFVLLLAFSEMDVVKYKAVSGSMKMALGVKADSHEITLPEGQPADTPEIRGEEPPKPDAPKGSTDAPKKGDGLSEEALLVRAKLAEEIEAQRIELEVWPDRVLIRLPEQGVFPSGSARLHRDFVPVLVKIRDVLAITKGAIAVAGHTDPLPISNERFRSNWDLSASRAASVVHVLLSDDRVVPRRIVAQGYADTRPIVPNTSKEERARNRRVDIILATSAPPPPPKPKPAPAPEDEGAEGAEGAEGSDGPGAEGEGAEGDGAAGEGTDDGAAPEGGQGGE